MTSTIHTRVVGKVELDINYKNVAEGADDDAIDTAALATPSMLINSWLPLDAPNSPTDPVVPGGAQPVEKLRENQVSWKLYVSKEPHANSFSKSSFF